MLFHTSDEERARQAAFDSLAAAADARRRTHRALWVSQAVLGPVFILLGVYVNVGTLPIEVNAVAYLAGASQHAVFIPVTSNSNPSSASGYLEDSRTHTTWPGSVFVGRPFPVRAPIWNPDAAWSALNPGIIKSGPYAAEFLLAMWPIVSILDLLTIALGITFLRSLRRTRFRRRPRAARAAI